MKTFAKILAVIHLIASAIALVYGFTEFNKYGIGDELLHLQRQGAALGIDSNIAEVAAANARAAVAEIIMASAFTTALIAAAIYAVMDALPKGEAKQALPDYSGIAAPPQPDAAAMKALYDNAVKGTAD